MNIPVASPEQMRKIERIMSEEFGVSPLQLMELAGSLVARVAIELFNPNEILVLVGKGNNGGDGLVAARHLHNLGAEPHVVLSGELKELPLTQLRTVERIGIPVSKEICGTPDMIIDSLLGYSSRGAPRGRVGELVEDSLELKIPVLSVDIPTGLDISTGGWFSPAFKGATVVTLGLPKPNMIGNAGIGKLILGDIGITRDACRKAGLDVPVLFRNHAYFEIPRSGSSLGKYK